MWIIYEESKKKLREKIEDGLFSQVRLANPNHKSRGFEGPLALLVHECKTENREMKIIAKPLDKSYKAKIKINSDGTVKLLKR